MALKERLRGQLPPAAPLLPSLHANTMRALLRWQQAGLHEQVYMFSITHHSSLMHKKTSQMRPASSSAARRRISSPAHSPAAAARATTSHAPCCAAAGSVLHSRSRPCCLAKGRRGGAVADRSDMPQECVEGQWRARAGIRTGGMPLMPIYATMLAAGKPPLYPRPPAALRRQSLLP